MIDFELTDQQKALQKMARDFAESEIKTIAAEQDKATDHVFNHDLAAKMAQKGFMRMSIAKKYGGLELDHVTQAIILEEIAAGDLGAATIAGWNCTAPFLMAKATEEQKEKIMPLFTKPGEPRLSALALTEPNAGSDAAAVQTTAQLNGDHYVLNGRKCFITHASVASVYFVAAMTDMSKGPKGMSAFIVPADSEGLSFGKIEDKMGSRGSLNGDVIFQDVRVPKENLIGREGEGFGIVAYALEKVRPLVTGAFAVGVARAAYDEALKYSRERVQFGKPIINHQAVALMLADMAAQVETARLLTWYTCWLQDTGRNNAKFSALDKIYTSDVAMNVTQNAVQIFGGYGYMRDFPVEKLMRDAKVLQIWEGTNQVLRFVAARLL